MILKSKAQNLKFLKKKLKISTIPNLQIFKCKNFFRNREKILNTIKKNFKKKIAIRSSFTSEDNTFVTGAGKYDSILNVNSQNYSKLEKSIEKVILSKKKIVQQDEFFIQQMCENVKTSGVVFVENLKDQTFVVKINYYDGKKTDIVTSGKKGSRSLVYYSNKKYKIPKKFANLFKSIMEVKKIFKNIFLDIEFAIDKSDKIFILQVRKLNITKKKILSENSKILLSIEKKIEKLNTKHFNLFGKKTSFGNMPDWNPAEIIGTKPKPLALSLYRELITDHIWSKNRLLYGYKDLDQFHLMTCFYGTPYIDTRIDFNSWIPNSLSQKISEKIVNFYQKQFDSDISNQDKIEFNIIVSCLTFSSHKKIFNKFKNILNRKEQKVFYESIKRCTLIAFNQITEDIKLIKKLPNLQKKIANSSLYEVDKIYWLLEHCKKYGTLPFAGLARCGFIGIEILNSLEDEKIITNHQKQKFFESINTVATEMKIYHNTKSKSEFIKKYGHLRPDTYEISALNYKEGYKLYFNNKKKINHGKSKLKFYNLKIPKAQLKKIRLNKSQYEINKFIKNSIYFREYSKFIFTKSIDLIFNNLIKFGKKFSIKREDLSYLEIKDITDLYSNLYSAETIQNLKLKIKNNKKQYNFHKHIELPDVIRNNRDIYIREAPNNKINFISEKNVEGKLIELNKKNLKKLSGKIICIKNADPGYDFLFNKNIKGLITCYGGLNSHIAIRCKEINMPALIGVGRKNYKNIIKHQYININCNSKMVTF